MGVSIGASHICLGVKSIYDVQPLLEIGDRKILFNQSIDVIPEQKFPFLRLSVVGQRMAYSFAPQGIGIEAIAHQRTSISDPLYTQITSSSFLPVIPFTADSPKKESIYSSLVGEYVEESLLPDGTSLLRSSERATLEPFLTKLILFTPDIQITTQFLKEVIGATPYRKNCMRISSLNNRVLDIFLVFSHGTQKTYLDDIGWVCLSFDVKKIQTTVQTLKLYGVTEVGEPFSVRTNQREYSVIFARGPHGELYEFLETVKIFR